MRSASTTSTSSSVRPSGDLGLRTPATSGPAERERLGDRQALVALAGVASALTGTVTTLPPAPAGLDDEHGSDARRPPSSTAGQQAGRGGREHQLGHVVDGVGALGRVVQGHRAERRRARRRRAAATTAPATATRVERRRRPGHGRHGRPW